MARKKAKEKLEEVADQAGYPEAKDYLQRLIADSDLRDSLSRAAEASRRASDRVGKARKPGKLLDDKKLHADIQEALDAFRSAASGIADAPGKAAKKGRRRGRKLMILVVGGGLALVGSEGLRSKVLDTLFGAEEEFEYAPPPPPPDAPAPPAAAPEPPAEAEEPAPEPEPEPEPEEEPTAEDPADGAA
jgi:cell division septation protein DedD